jgi:hypothetical protein
MSSIWVVILVHLHLRSENVGEISLHTFSLPYLIEAAKAGATLASPDFVAILRSGLSLQIKWVVSLYDKV